MADATGPISTLPGTSHKVPAGTMCDDHPDVPATHRVQGETDSFGSEMIDLCDACYQTMQTALNEPVVSVCEWCCTEGVEVKPFRDWEEGMSGPVYDVCAPCRQKSTARAHDLADEIDDDQCDDD